MNSNTLIPAMILAPFAGALVVALSRESHARAVAAFWALFTFAISLLLAWRFDWHQGGETQFPLSVEWVAAFGLNFSFGIDSISLWLILLTTFLQTLVVFATFASVTQRAKEFYFWLLILQSAMLGTFVATDAVFFYICFEFTLVPLYFLIGIFGSAQRTAAARVFFLYTFTGSMITFAGVLYVAWFNSQPEMAGLYAGAGEWSFDMQTLYLAAHHLTAAQQTWILVAMLAGFAVKLPLFPFHTWQPLTYAEAPTAGTVLLAGVMAKLGSYGMLRLAIPLAPAAALHYAPVIATLAVIGILYTALICWAQKDLKKLVAYSSISHLGFVVLGLFALNTIGVGGSVFYMVSHGLSTGALFLCIGMLHERFQTREMSQMSGLAKVMPVWAFFMVFFSLASVGLPGLNGFVGEFLTLLGAFTAEKVLGPVYAGIAGIGMILAAIYILHMVGKVVWGPLKLPRLADAPAPAAGEPAPKVADLGFREIAVLAPLAVACLALGLAPTPMLRSLEPAVDRLIAPMQEVAAADVSSPAHTTLTQARAAAQAAAPAGNVASETAQ
ncbi:MAG: NADH-quinone oxidoreductase subunit M [Planctomycetota bacterium]|nr:NADH-quinone oxidoreductase subunit M [Planctomycetota bacterium]